VSEQPDGAARVWAMAHLGTPMALRVAATLRVADHIADGSDAPWLIAAQAGADADALDRLMRFLAARGVLLREGAGRYSLTPLGEALRDDHPSGLRRMLDIDTAVGRAELAFVQLLHSVRTGEAGYPLQFGRSFWADMAAETERADSFDTWMSSSMPQRAPAIVAAYDWGSLGHLVDVGGGDGTLMIELLKAYRDLCGTVLDAPSAAATARRALTAAGLDARSGAVPGSFFDPLPAGAGGYLLSFILHDWPDEAAIAILRRCAEAAGSTGKVFVVEDTGPDGRSPHSGMDLRMLVHLGGKERDLDALTKLAAEAGLRVRQVHPAGSLSIAELGAK